MGVFLVAIERRRRVLAIVTGGIFGYGLWIGLQPDLQFGGAYEVVTGFGFMIGIAAAQTLTIAQCAIVVSALRRLSQSARRLIIVIAGIAFRCPAGDSLRSVPGRCARSRGSRSRGS